MQIIHFISQIWFSKIKQPLFYLYQNAFNDNVDDKTVWKQCHNAQGHVKSFGNLDSTWERIASEIFKEPNGSTRPAVCPTAVAEVENI